MDHMAQSVTGRDLAKTSRDASEQFQFVGWSHGIGPEVDVILGSPLFVFLRRCVGRVDEEETFTAPLAGLVRSLGDLSRGDPLPPDKFILTISANAPAVVDSVGRHARLPVDDRSTGSTPSGDSHVPTWDPEVRDYSRGEETNRPDEPVGGTRASDSRGTPPERPVLPQGWVFNERITKRHYRVTDDKHVERVLKYFDDDAEFRDEWKASIEVRKRCPEWQEFLVPLEDRLECSDNNCTYGVLRFVRYPTLERYRVTTLEEVERITVALVDAVARLHQSNLAHLDIKPSNIFVDVREQSQTVLLADFTLASDRRSHTTEFRLSGTFDYLPRSYREARKTAGQWVDCYSIGITVDRLLKRLSLNDGALDGRHWLSDFVHESRKESWSTAGEQVRWIRQNKSSSRPRPEGVVDAGPRQPLEPRATAAKADEVKVSCIDVAELLKRAHSEHHQGHLKEALDYWARAADLGSTDGVAEYLEHA